MTPELIKTRLGKIIRPYMDSGNMNGINPDALKGSEHLKNDLCVDSADVVEIVLDIEAEFAIAIEDASIEKFVYVNDIVQLISEKTAAKV